MQRVHDQGRRIRHVLAWGCVFLLGTGIAWLLLHDAWRQQTPFGTQPHPLVAWLLRMHGMGAWCVSVLGGAVWQLHVRPAWRRARRRRVDRRAGPASRERARARARTFSGAALTSSLGLLLATAIGLQYAPEAMHAWISVIHWAVGVLMAAALAWHWLARRH
ncbi:MAG: hypothetical protein ABW032_04560 [Burkholderiaceae bacterium]